MSWTKANEIMNHVDSRKLSYGELIMIQLLFELIDCVGDARYKEG